MHEVHSQWWMQALYFHLAYHCSTEEKRRCLLTTGHILQRWQLHFRDASYITWEVSAWEEHSTKCNDLECTPIFKEVSVMARNRIDENSLRHMFPEIYHQVERRRRRRDKCLDFSVKIWNGKEILTPATSWQLWRKMTDNFHGYSLPSRSKTLPSRLLNNCVKQILSWRKSGFR